MLPADSPWLQAASKDGRKVMDQYYDKRRIGDVLFELRSELLTRNIPLGLWYSMQCPLDLEAPIA